MFRKIGAKNQSKELFLHTPQLNFPLNDPADFLPRVFFSDRQPRNRSGRTHSLPSPKLQCGEAGTDSKKLLWKQPPNAEGKRRRRRGQKQRCLLLLNSAFWRGKEAFTKSPGENCVQTYLTRPSKVGRERERKSFSFSKAVFRGAKERSDRARIVRRLLQNALALFPPDPPPPLSLPFLSCSAIFQNSKCPPAPSPKH